MLPIVLIGLAHAMQATLLTPLLNKHLSNQNLMPRVLSVLKVLEGMILAISMYIYGHVRQSEGNYSGVNLLIIIGALIGAAASFQLSNMTEQAGKPSTENEIEYTLVIHEPPSPPNPSAPRGAHSSPETI